MLSNKNTKSFFTYCSLYVFFSYFEPQMKKETKQKIYFLYYSSTSIPSTASPISSSVPFSVPFSAISIPISVPAPSAPSAFSSPPPPCPPPHLPPPRPPFPPIPACPSSYIPLPLVHLMVAALRRCQSLRLLRQLLLNELRSRQLSHQLLVLSHPPLLCLPPSSLCLFYQTPSWLDPEGPRCCCCCCCCCCCFDSGSCCGTKETNNSHLPL